MEDADYFYIIKPQLPEKMSFSYKKTYSFDTNLEKYYA